MYNDSWILALLLTKIFCLLLLFYASLHGISIAFRWQANSTNSLQLSLERKTYLISSIISLVLLFELMSFVLFVVLVNTHLPTIIKGAMCASGVLNSNEYGTPTLFVKAAALLVYVAFLALQYLDDAEPLYPLTPKKYGYIVPIVVCSVADFVLQLLFFGGLQPDKIVTCCSVNFVGTSSPTHLEFLGGGFSSLQPFVWAWVAVAILTGIATAYNNNKNYYLQILLAVIYTILGCYTLKYFFVKYIYGVPSHYCLYDTLLGNYHYIGFLLFGAYFVLLFNIVVMTIFYKNGQNLTYKFTQESKLLKNTNIAILIFNTLIPLLYWLFWQGDL